MTVIFSGENPGLSLYQPGSEARVAAISYWRSVYTEHGEGNALLIWVDPETSGLGDDAPHAIYTDNPAMAKLVAERFTRHFGGFDALDWPEIEPAHARFFQESDSRWYHRVVANTGDSVIELTWSDVIDYQPVNRENYLLGPSSWHLTTLICPCRNAEVRINDRAVEGEVHVRDGENGPTSSCFLAYSETWVETG